MWLIIVDAHLKWPIVIPTKDTTGDNTTEMLLDTFATHGLCEKHHEYNFTYTQTVSLLTLSFKKT